MSGQEATEVKTYGVEEHLKKAKPETAKLFGELKNRLMSFGSDVKEKATKYEVRYETESVFVAMRIGRGKIKAWIKVNPATFKDLKQIVKTMKWSPPHFFYINSMEEVDYAISLIRQAYDFSR